MYKIRLAMQSDVPAMLNIYRPFIEDSWTSFEMAVPTQDAFWQRVCKVLPENPWLVCEWQGDTIAYAYSGTHRSRHAYQWNRELSVYVHPDHYGRGIAKALYTALFDILIWQGYTNTLIGIALPNEASVRFHESMGYQLVGIYHRVGYKMGKYHDVGWWEKLLDSGEEPPGTILSLEELAGTKTWEEIIKKAEVLIKTNKV